MGIQQFLITTDLFQLEEGHLQVSYRLLTLDGEQEFANYQLLVEWEVDLIKLLEIPLALFYKNGIINHSRELAVFRDSVVITKLFPALY